MGCIVSKLFLDFYIFFIFTRPLNKKMLKKHLCLLVKTTVHPSSHMVPLMLMDCQL